MHVPNRTDSLFIHSAHLSGHSLTLSSFAWSNALLLLPHNVTKVHLGSKAPVSSGRAAAYGERGDFAGPGRRGRGGRGDHAHGQGWLWAVPASLNE